MIENANKHPYIVAYGSSKEDIIAFYIEVERHLIPVSMNLDKNSLHQIKTRIINFFQLPSEYGIIETFDTFFKLHHVFGLTFDKVLENMVVFIQRLIYNLRKGKASSANMQNFFEKLL